MYSLFILLNLCHKIIQSWGGGGGDTLNTLICIFSSSDMRDSLPKELKEMEFIDEEDDFDENSELTTGKIN